MGAACDGHEMTTMEPSTGPGRETRYRVTGMDCGSCAAKVDAAVRRLPGVEDVSVSATTGNMTVRHTLDLAPSSAIKAQLKPLGYDVSPAGGTLLAEKSAAHSEHDETRDLHAHAHGHGDDGPLWRSPKARLTAGCGAALALAFALGQVAPWTERWAFGAALAVGLAPIARRAFVAARVGVPFSIEMLMTIAAVGAVIIGAMEEAAAVVFLFLVGELLEGVAAGRARASIKALITLVPATALLEADGATKEVGAEQLAVGSIILVRPGDRIAADGVIVDGEGAIDESLVTGESTPVRKRVGDNVFAGTINSDALLRVKVTAASSDNTISRIVRLVEEAQESKAPAERFIDRFSRFYTPAVVAVAALVGVAPPLLAGGDWSAWIYKGLAVLLIGCPCALVISTPAAIAASLSAGARRGLLLKGGAVLESLGKLTTIAFDKTGTLTEGKPVVTDVEPFGHAAPQVLALAAALESGSSHPLATAILARAKIDGVAVPPASDVKNLPGKGVAGQVGGETVFLGSAAAGGAQAELSTGQAGRIAELNDEGKTVSVLIVGGALVGLIAMRDEPRADAQAGIAALRVAGITPIMLTGDNGRTAAAIAKALGVEPFAELLPEDKQRIVQDLQANGHRVGKVGDGINDAPALAAADVGIAMGGGTDVALETADAAVLHGRVLDVARMVKLSRRTMANIHQNITIAIGLKVVFLGTTIIGLTGLWPAILADTGATVLVTLNALRLLAPAPD